MNDITSNSYEILSSEFRLFEAVPGNNLLIRSDSPRFTMLAASESYLQLTGKSKTDLIGIGVFEAFPPRPEGLEDSEDLKASFLEVLATKKTHQLPVQRYDIHDVETHFIEKYWRISNSPVLNEEGDVAYIINSVEDITQDIKTKQQELQIKSLQQAQNLLSQAPMSIQIFKGQDLIVELANDLTLKMWDRDASALGKPYLDIFPELKGHGYEILMQEVIKTGVAKSFYEIPVKLNKGGKEELGYYNVVYQPYYEENKTQAVGVLVFSNEVTRIVIYKLFETLYCRFFDLIVLTSLAITKRYQVN